MGHFRFADNPAEPERNVELIGIGAQGSKPDTSKSATCALDDLRNQQSTDPATPKLWMHVEMADSPNLGRLRVWVSIEPADPHKARSNATLEQDLARTIKSIRARLPVIARALHRAEVFAQTERDELAEVLRQFTDALNAGLKVSIPWTAAGMAEHPAVRRGPCCRAEATS